MEYIVLNDGNSVPMLCFGPGMMSRGVKFQTGIIGRVQNKILSIKLQRSYVDANKTAIENGARFIDYSATYANEHLVAKAIKLAGIKREDVILTTRVSKPWQLHGHVRQVVLDSIKRFGTNYIDLLEFHWPVTDCYVDTWKEMVKMKSEGICKSIGVANCHQHHIEKLIQETGVIPAVNQIEIHPLFTQKPLLQYCKDKNIVVEAYTPLARMDERMTRLPLMKNIAKIHNKTISQIILRWHIQNGVVPVFRSMNAQRQKENFDIFDFELTTEEMNAIDSININSRLRYDPDNCDFSIL